MKKNPKMYIYIYILVWARTYACAAKLVGGLRETVISNYRQLLFSDFTSDFESFFDSMHWIPAESSAAEFPFFRSGMVLSTALN